MRRRPSGPLAAGRPLQALSVQLRVGLVLPFKATTELHERLEGVSHTHNGPRIWASFSVVVTQIVLLDAVFSLDRSSPPWAWSITCR